ncbi:MAG: cobyric acid synthase [Lachnospiraceae bacterium]|nr:cobyric acid synthase [Lachnospiraceae bacterium]
MAKAIMIQGTMSNAGKSLLAAGLCRIFKQDGYRVAPFKSQNMALNSCITREGLEIGRAQAVQAEAAGIKPTADMNPILLKPVSDMGSQVIVRGIPQGNMTAREYFSYKKSLIPQIEESYQRLAAQYDIIVIEGAGSPAEINLKQEDIVNMGMAKLANAPVLLAGDIDRGGVFAQLYGTAALLEPEERSYIKGLIVNKFRGDKSLLEPGIEMLKKLCSIPTIGVVPYMDVTIEDEDSLSGFLEEGKDGEEGGITIGVIRFPRISNFTDFAVFSCIPGVKIRFISGPKELGCPDMVILPGTKSTIKDLLWMRQNGLEAAVLKLAERQIPVWGICGGYQMLGEELTDPEGVEYNGMSGAEGHIRGMGLLPLKTVFEKEKTRTLVTGSLGELAGIFADLTGHNVEGYEIHMGRTTINREEGIIDTGRIVNKIPEICRPTAYLMERQDSGKILGKQVKIDGYSRGNVYGAYVHGIFDAEGMAPAIVKALASKKGVDLAGEMKHFDYKAYRESQYDKLAAILRESLDMEAIYRILEEGAGKKEPEIKAESKVESVLPAEIEAKSFSIISRELAQKRYVIKPEEEPVLKRVIHTTADFDYAENLVFSPGAGAAGIRALSQGGVIITDTQMAWSGINKRKLKELGGEALCFMADGDVAEAAKQRGITRAAASMDKAAAMFGEDWGPVIVAVGNAPTALIRLYELIKEGKIRPSLIVAVPVGFVNVVPAKEQILTLSDIPFIVARGRKGGSNVAAAICNALLYQVGLESGDVCQ